MPLISFFNFGDYYHAQRKSSFKKQFSKLLTIWQGTQKSRSSFGEGLRWPQVNEIFGLADLPRLKLALWQLNGRSLFSNQGTYWPMPLLQNTGQEEETYFPLWAMPLSLLTASYLSFSFAKWRVIQWNIYWALAIVLSAGDIAVNKADKIPASGVFGWGYAGKGDSQ